MRETQQGFGLTVELHTEFETALQRVSEALQAEGFGVLTEIDVKQTLKKKLDVDFRPYKILGACNPPLAHRALSAVPEIGLLLPCNVTVEQMDDATIKVSLVNPMAMMGFVDNPTLASVAAEAHDKLSRVAAALQEA